MITVLVVDDEPLLLRFAQTVLEGGGHRVLPFESAEEALKCCRERRNELDLVISDVHMPGMSGRELAECLLREPKPIPVVLMSGNAQTAKEIAEGVKSGSAPASYLLPKPFRPDQLLDVVSEVERAIRRRGGAQAPA